MRLLLALFLLAPALVHAQPRHATDRGSYLVGGGAGISRQDGTTAAFLSPNAGYFLVPGLAVGTQVQLGIQHSGDETMTTLGIGPQVAYYLGSEERSLIPYVSAGLSYTTLHYGEGDFSFLTGSAATGVAFLLARNVALTGEAYTTIYRDRIDSQAPTVPVSTSVSTAFGLRGGVRVFVW